jgi:hypothetical protein
MENPFRTIAIMAHQWYLGLRTRISGFGHHHHNVRLYELHPHRSIHIMTDVTVGHTVTDDIIYLDQNGNPMKVSPTLDGPPVWSNIADATVDTLVVSADGTVATISALAEGQDSISLGVMVGGVAYKATQQLNISPAPQVLTSVDISATVA